MLYISGMEKDKIKDIPVQGTEVVKEKKKQKKSTSYALKAIKSHIETLGEDELLEKQERETMNNIVKKAAEKFIKREYGIE